MSVIQGVPPTASQKLLIKAGESLGPDKALATLDSLARLILTSVVLVSSVLTGFGLFTDVPSRLGEQSSVLGVPIFFAICSAVAALLALVPWVGKVDVDNLNSLKRVFKWLVLIRSALVSAGLIFLLAGVLASTSGLRQYLAASGPSTPELTLSSASSADGTAVTATAKASRLPAGARAEMLLISGSAGREIGRTTMIVGSTGEVDLLMSVPKVTDATQLKLTFAVTAAGRTVLHAEVEGSGQL